MCTTVLLLGTLVMMLRRRFFNKVEPYVLSHPLPVPSGPWGRGQEGEGWPWGGRPCYLAQDPSLEIFGSLLVAVLWVTPGDIPLWWAEGSLLCCAATSSPLHQCEQGPNAGLVPCLSDAKGQG